LNHARAALSNHADIPVDHAGIRYSRNSAKPPKQ
jgi:hypothetical protein